MDPTSNSLATISGPPRDSKATRYQWLWVPTLIYLATRAGTWGVLTWAQSRQFATSAIPPNSPWERYFVFRDLPAAPGVLGVSTNWDGQWYQFIAERGYLPPEVDGSADAAHAWQFPPLYPMTVRAMMSLTGWEFDLAAVVTSLLLGMLAMVLVYRLFESHVGGLRAACVVALISCYPTAALLQTAYSESLAFALVAANLLLLRRQQFWWSLLPLVLLSFTRLITPPLALVALAVAWQKRRHLTMRQRLGLACHAMSALVGVAFWSRTAGLLGAGVESDRAKTMVNSLDGGWLGVTGVLSAPSLVLATFMLLGSAAIWSQRWHWGTELAAWGCAYPVFILIVTPPMSGVFRYFILAFPLALIVVGSARRSTRATIIATSALCVVFSAVQFLWIREVFILDPLIPGPSLMP